jgi:NADH-quinone oxidoreductase subunit N
MENISSIIQNTKLIYPEIVLSLGIIVVLIFDLIFKNEKKRFLNYITLAVLAVVAITLRLTNSANNTLAFNIFQINQIAYYFKSIILLATFVVLLYLFTSKEVDNFVNRLGEFHLLILGMLLGMFFIVGAADLILIYIAMETMSLSSYVLSGFDKTKMRNSEASLKYLVYGSAASGIMLFGISLIYGSFATTNILVIKYLLLNNFIVNPIIVNFAIILILVGISYKISAAPFHYWAPDVYEGAPISITAYLSVASKAAGFAMLINVLQTFVLKQNQGWIVYPVFDWKFILIILSVLSMFFGNFTALWQNNIKRMLAYSSIAHLGYMLLGIIAFSELGLVAVLSYFLIYLFMNLGAFYVAMVIADNYGIENIDEYKGLGPKLPFLGTTLAIFLVSLVGIPPLAGFIPKFYLFTALIEKDMILLSVIALINTVISLYYYIRVLKEMYLSNSERDDITEQNIDPLNKYIPILLSIPILLFGVYFSPIYEFLKNIVK